MKKILKTMIGCVLLMTGTIGCTQPSSAPSSVVEEPTSGKQKEKNVSDAYKTLRTDSRYFVLEQAGVEPFIDSATGILLIADSKKDISEKYVVLFDKVLEESDVSCAYFEATTDSEYMNQLLTKVKEHNDSGLEISESGFPTPLALFINNGTIFYLDDESEAQWSNALETELYSTLKINADLAKKAQDENSSSGCEAGCKLEG